jgi:hypothetical protein
MADTHDDSTGWTAFYTYLIRRADKIVPLTAREQEAERLIFKEIHNGDLELRWLDIDGRVHIGLPRGWFGWYVRYDLSADVIRELPLPNARVLYQPQLRERQRNLDQPADSAVKPEHADVKAGGELNSAREEPEPVIGEGSPPDDNPSAVAGVSPPTSSSLLPASESAPSGPTPTIADAAGANTGTPPLAAEESLTPEVLPTDAPDQVSQKEPKTKTDRVMSLLPGLDEQRRFKPEMTPAEIERIVSPLYKGKWTDVPGRDQIWRAYQKYREKHPLIWRTPNKVRIC